jgi:hypothetical protein
VAKDNTFAQQNQIWQLDQTRWRHSLAGCTVTIHPEQEYLYPRPMAKGSHDPAFKEAFASHLKETQGQPAIAVSMQN